MQDMQEMWVRSLGREVPLEEEIATHSSILARKFPRTEKPGGLQSMGWQKSDTIRQRSNSKSTEVSQAVTVMARDGWADTVPVIGF